MKRILFIEPDLLLQRIYTQAFERAAYEARACAAAQAAIDALDSWPADIVVLELQLPGHGGIEFLHEFRSYAEWDGVPVILQTYVPPQQLAALRRTLRDDLGVQAIHYKPRTSLQALMQSVEEVLAAAK